LRSEDGGSKNCRTDRHQQHLSLDQVDFLRGFVSSFFL
jgi:hypothetical protein